MTPEQAYRHCLEHGRNADLENIIATDPRYAYDYALGVIQGRWIKAEKIIATDAYCAYLYAQGVIQDRWIEAENIIATDPRYAYYYARDVIKGRLPENMHNMMLLHADEWAKHYLNVLINCQAYDTRTSIQSL